jgi:putative acetyltransferase
MLTLRHEQRADRAAIHAVHATSFPSADEAELVDALRAAGHLTLSLVAVEQSQVVGHVAFSPVSVPDGPDGLGLAPVAVLPAFRRRGIAAQLIRAALAECAEAGCGFVVVLGDPSYYGRFGFAPASTFGLYDEYQGGEAFQALELRPGAIPRGVVRYAPAFSAL